MSDETTEAGDVIAPQRVQDVLITHNETLANLCEALANLDDRLADLTDRTERLERAYDRQLLTDRTVRKIVSLQ